MKCSERYASEHDLAVWKFLEDYIYNDTSLSSYPLTQRSDQQITSPHNINTLSCKQMMRINMHLLFSLPLWLILY